MQILNTANNENGFVLVASLMILMILVVLGIAAINTTTIEQQIAGNEKVAKDNFYNAEAAAQEGAQRLENENDSDNLRAKRSSFKWLFSGTDEDGFLDDPAEWQAIINDLLSGLNNSAISLVAIDKGVVKGKKSSSLKITSSSLYEYHLLGRATKNNGQKIIEIGYKKRF